MIEHRKHMWIDDEMRADAAGQRIRRACFRER